MADLFTLPEFLVCWALTLIGLVYLACDAEILFWPRWRLKAAHGFVARFFAAAVSCRPCASAWLAPLAAAVSWAFFSLPPPWCDLFWMVIVAPLWGIGLSVVLALVSLSNAVDVVFKRLGKR